MTKNMLKLRAQLEFYFSPQNLSRDVFIRQTMAASPDNSVPVATLATFARVNAIVGPGEDVAAAIRDAVGASRFVELTADGAGVCVTTIDYGATAAPADEGTAAPADAPADAPAAAPADRAAKVPCKLFPLGRCQFGDACRYLHDSVVDPRREAPCKFYSSGHCRNGAACLYSHDAARNDAYVTRWLAPDAPLSCELDAVVNGLVDVPQPLEVIIVLDLEGTEDIVELPALAISVPQRREIGRFHRWTLPVYVPPNPELSAVPFPAALEDFVAWATAQLPPGRPLSALAIMTCGAWDLATAIPKGCAKHAIEVPPLCLRTVNIKSLYNQHYKPRRRVTGMKGLLGKLGLLRAGGVVEGHHHLGMDDVANIARCCFDMLDDGVTIAVTDEFGPDVSSDGDEGGGSDDEDSNSDA
eukprot:c53180_g1_i1.p1 GENE.c53180_g1_i1~~c53180_g1_i1.p1  ORF type:complete len:485 (+),score=79.81 c53180_g1_i1:217-1455(+)